MFGEGKGWCGEGQSEGMDVVKGMEQEEADGNIFSLLPLDALEQILGLLPRADLFRGIGSTCTFLRDAVRSMLQKNGVIWRYIGRRKGGSVAELFEVMRSPSSLLVYVALRPSCFGELGGGKQLALQAMASCHNMKGLMLCDFSEEDLLTILRSKAVVEKLTHLQLCGGIISLTTALTLGSSGFACLKSLMLLRCHIEKEAAAELLQLNFDTSSEVGVCGQLRRAGASKPRVVPCTHMSSLQRVVLDGCSIGDRGAVVLLRARFPLLTRLDRSWVELDEDGSAGAMESRKMSPLRSAIRTCNKRSTWENGRRDGSRQGSAMLILRGCRVELQSELASTSRFHYLNAS